MKSLIKIALALLSVSLPFRAYAGWGAGFNAGYWKMDAGEFEKDKAYMNGPALSFADSRSVKITQGAINPDINVFYEAPLKGGLLYGLSAGYGSTAGVESQVVISDTLFNYTRSIENTTTAIPVQFYIKKNIDDKPYSVFGGVGVNFLSLKTTFKESNGKSGAFEKTKLAPNVAAGGEYFLMSNVSLGMNLKYIFSAKVKDLRGTVNGVKKKLIMVDDGHEYVDDKNASASLASDERLFEYDYSGLRINFALRYYFGDSGATVAPVRKAEPVKQKTRPSYLDDDDSKEPVRKPAPAVKKSNNEQQKLDLEREKLKLEREKFEFEKQKQEYD